MQGGWGGAEPVGAVVVELATIIGRRYSLLAWRCHTMGGEIRTLPTTRLFSPLPSRRTNSKQIN